MVQLTVVKFFLYMFVEKLQLLYIADVLEIHVL